MRDRDEDLHGQTLEARVSVCHNWRADASALITDTGKMLEWVKYSGVPDGLPAGDTDSDGDWDATDSAAIAAACDARKDADLNGTVDSTADVAHANSIVSGYPILGRNVMTSTGVASRKGYAGYELDPSLWGTADKGRTFWHVRHRVLDSGLGRWVQRDPAGYVDGAGLYAYAASRPVVGIDPMGMDTAIPLPCAGPSCPIQPGVQPPGDIIKRILETCEGDVCKRSVSNAVCGTVERWS